ncbi:tol [Fusarium phyllophilum]|uniref:Tol n=1 Tax=Fusarium phyllophilum TaxID=47803 RepID=A0A8H5IPQ5_9HYPO|nr:tol [Fusarium phyllophilum]
MSSDSVVYHYLAIGKLGRGEVVKLFLKDAGINFEEKRYKYPDTWPETSEKLKQQGITRTGSLPSLEYKGLILTQHIPILRFLSRDLGKYDGQTNEDKYLVDAVSDIYVDWRSQWVANLKGATDEYKNEFLPKYYDLIAKYYSDREGPYLLGDEVSYTDFAIYQSIDNDTRTKTIPSKIPDVLLKFKEVFEARPNIAEYIKSDNMAPSHFSPGFSPGFSLLELPPYLLQPTLPNADCATQQPHLICLLTFSPTVRLRVFHATNPRIVEQSERIPSSCIVQDKMSENAPRLCSACAAINFDKLFFPDPAPFNPSHRPPPDPCLGTLQEILDRSEECDVCNLIIEAHRQRYIRAPYGYSTNHPDFRSEVPGEEPEIHEEVMAHGLRLTVNKEPIRCFLESRNFSSDRILLNSGRGLDPETGGVNRVLLRLEPCPWMAILANSITLQAVWPSKENQTTSNGIRLDGTGRMIGSLLDLSIPQRWIKQCEDQHGEECQRPKWLSDSDTEWPERCRVIDVKEHRIVDLLPTMRYVALSYVWGSSEKARQSRFERRLTRENLSRLQQPNSLSEIYLPQAIKDAMHVTEQVGERFLWVDALCIVQDDPADLGRQTARMDLIYSKALFTILAACGEDSTSGLARLPSNPRDVFQRQVKVSSSGLHIMPLVTLSEEDTLQFSTWNTRGWTFQERLLSRRSLIFTNKQVYWCCDGTTWEEESLLDIPGSTAFARSYSFGCYDEWDDNEAKFSLDSFDQYITQFSERKFTYASDVLPAFLGIIRRFEHLNNEKIHWGLNASTFDQALTWKYGQNRRDETYTYVSGGLTRSVPYPSWSWLGWTGFIGGSSSLRIGEDYSKRGVGEMKSLLAFYSLMSDGSVSLIKGTSLRRVNDYGKEYVAVSTEKSSHDWIGDAKVVGPIKTDHISLASESEELSVDQPEPYDTGRIVFWTSHANISIQITHRDGIHMETSNGLVKIDLKLSSPFMKKSYCRFEDALNESSDPAESKVMNFLRRKPVATNHTISLIIISRYYGFYEGDDEVVKLNVMAVEEEVPGSGVWSRIGLGVIEEEDWVKLDIDWRMAILELCNIELRGLETWKAHVKSDGQQTRDDFEDDDPESESGIEEDDAEEDQELVATEFVPGHCLFCTKDSSTLDESMKHMSTTHSFNIPFQEFLAVDLETLVSYLHFVINTYRECVCCGTRRSTVEGIQHHMLAKGHCRFDISPETEEFYEVPQYEDALGDRKHDASDPVRLPSGRVISHRKHEEPRAPRREAEDKKRLDTSAPVEPGMEIARRQTVNGSREVVQANEAILAAQLSRFKVTSDRAAQREEKRWRGRLERANNFFALKRFRLDAADSRMGRQF